MTATAERMKAMRPQRRGGGLRERRLLVPDARSRAVRTRFARAVSRLDRVDEADALTWIESVAEFDELQADIETMLTS